MSGPNSASSRSFENDRAKRREVNTPASRVAPIGQGMPCVVALKRAVADQLAARPAEILALQRRYGNRAVIQLLTIRNHEMQTAREAEGMGAKAGTMQDSARPRECSQEDVIASPSSPQPTFSGAVQRLVGFEFEDSYWRPWLGKRFSLFAPRPVRRKEVIHVGTWFRIEGDDTPGPDQSNIEFVTIPFETTPGGLEKLNTAMREIREIEKRIGQYAGRSGKKRDYVTHQEHRLSKARLLLSQGKSELVLKMQATQGVSLENIQTIMQYFGTNVPDEADADAKKRAKARELIPPAKMGSSAEPGEQPKAELAISDLIGYAPSCAKSIIDGLRGNADAGQPLWPGESTDRLLGFLTMIVLYIKAFSMSQGGGALKYSAPFLGRTNFVVMFQELPASQKSYLIANPQKFISAIIDGVNTKSVLYDFNSQGIDTGFRKEVPLVRNLYVKGQVEWGRQGEGSTPLRPKVFASLTIENWLQGIVEGVDHLTPVTIKNWLAAHERKLPRRERNRQADTYLESFATVGSDKTGNTTNDPESGGKSRLMIIENRIIAPHRAGVAAPSMGGAALAGPPSSAIELVAPPRETFPKTPPIQNGRLNAADAHKEAFNYLQFFISLREGNPVYRYDDPPC